MPAYSDTLFEGCVGPRFLKITLNAQKVITATASNPENDNERFNISFLPQVQVLDVEKILCRILTKEEAIVVFERLFVKNERARFNWPFFS